MNIEIQICGLIIIFLLYFIYKSSNTLKLYTEKVFQGTMLASLMCLVFDILSVFAIHFKASLPSLLVLITCKLYLVSIIWTAAYVFIYVLTDPFSEEQHKKYKKIVTLITLLQTIIIFIAPVSIFSNGTAVYTFGPAVLIVYGFVIIYITAVLSTIVIHREKFNKRRAFSVGLWMLIYITAAIIQFMYNELLLVGFADTVGVLILFIIMENPEANRDRNIECFNSYALSQYMAYCFNKKEHFSLMEISFKNINYLDGSSISFRHILRSIVKLLKKNTDGKIFVDNNFNIVVISNNWQTLHSAGNIILHHFEPDAQATENISIIITKNNMAFNNIDEISKFYAYIRQSHPRKLNHIFFPDEAMINGYLERFIIKDKIASALQENRVEVFFQPIYSNEACKFTSAEALVRIRETDGSLLSPGIFIPVAEANGQIRELGERIFELVCSFIKHNDLDRLGIEYIEINLSVIQCQMTDLATRLIEITNKYNIDPARINLEITETGSISDRKILLNNMNILIDYGFSFSLDDFGKGESNLMYVIEMPVSIVKLDYDMTKSYVRADKAKHVLKAVVNMAHNLNLKLVAEGIETIDELRHMQNERIDYIQGYYYSKPLPVNNFIDYIQANNC